MDGLFNSNANQFFYLFMYNSKSICCRWRDGAFGWEMIVMLQESAEKMPFQVFCYIRISFTAAFV
jgi:hypothetical protein